MTFATQELILNKCHICSDVECLLKSKISFCFMRPRGTFRMKTFDPKTDPVSLVRPKGLQWCKKGSDIPGHTHTSFLNQKNFVKRNTIYYMEESVSLGTKPLVDSIRLCIRDPSGVFSVCHLCEYRIVQWRQDSRLLLLLNWFLVIIKRTLHAGSKTRMFSWQEQYLTSERSSLVRY